MEISPQNEPEFKKLRCFLRPGQSHFLSQPKLLPCGNMACSNCIQNAITTSENNLDCKLCGAEHSNLNLEGLKEADSIIDQINSDALIEEIEAKIENQIKTLKDSFENKREILEKVVDQAKKDVNTRVEVIKDHLDTLQKDLLKSLEIIQLNTHNVLVSMNSEAKGAIEKSESVVENMRKMLEDLDANREQLIEEIYECQEHVNGLIDLAEKFRLVMRKNIFEPSKWLPDEKFIYPHIDSFKLEEKEKPQANK